MLVSGTAQATTIDFETGAPPDFYRTLPLTTHYSAEGLTFSGVGGNGGSILDVSGNFGIPARSGSDFLAFNADPGSDATSLVEQVLFENPITTFSIYVGAGNDASYVATAYSSSGAILDNVTVSATSGSSSELVLSSADIFKVTFGVLDNDTFVADDLTFDASPLSGAPEPGAWLLMLSGVGALGFTMRRRRCEATVAA